MKQFTRNFVRCGLAGWCIEIIFTAIDSLRRRDFTLKGNTSIWMFPIYGCAALLVPINKLFKNKSSVTRGFIYMSLIFTAEYITGYLLGRKTLCPWDYHHSKWNVGRVIRLDFAPYWFAAGLLFERVLGLSEKSVK